MWYSPTPICIFNPVVHGLGNKGCAACDGLLSIAPNGDILPCSSYPRPVGNILEMAGNFRKAWRQGEFAFYQRKGFAQDRCQACEYLAVCNGGCPLYWDAVGIDELQFRRWPLEDLP
jgi:radical SAM protein with 4Fe4S-binding SPASM domain